LRRILLVSATVLALAAGGQPAGAHPTERFKACTRQIPGTCMPTGAAFNYGDLVVVRARARPPHAGSVAQVLRKRPHGFVFKRIGEVQVSNAGRMTFRWFTTRAAAVQDAPYLFRFRIRGHGASETTEAYVLFGE
jgi:hypothetical protein